MKKLLTGLLSAALCALALAQPTPVTVQPATQAEVDAGLITNKFVSPKTLAASATTGDVTGPASATDNALARFDGATGKLIQSSTAILTDAGGLSLTSLTASSLTAGRVTFAGVAGLLSDDSDLTFSADTLTFTKGLSGAIGIGTSTTAPATAFQVVDTGTATPRGITNDQYNTGTNGAQMNWRKARNTFASPATIVTGDLLGRAIFWGHDGTNFIESANIRAVSTGTIGTDRVPSVLEFYTSTDAAPSVLTKAFDIGPAQGLRFPSTNVTGIQLYNTADQTTNYERLNALWSANVAYVGIATGGTGASSGRLFRLYNQGSGGGFAFIDINSWQAAPLFNFSTTNSWSTTGNFVQIAPAQNPATSGTFGALAIKPTYNQASGNAANSDLLIQRTETAVGSGTQLLIQAGTAASPSLFTVSNTGSVSSAARIQSTLVGFGADINIGPIEARSTRPTAVFYDTGGGANAKSVVLDADGGGFVIWAINDAGNSGGAAFNLARTAAAATFSGLTILNDGGNGTFTNSSTGLSTFTGNIKLLTTKTVSFGATSNATLGVSADTTAGILQIVSPSSGTISLYTDSGQSSMLLSGGSSPVWSGNPAGNLVIRSAASGASRTMALQTTTSGGTPTTWVSANDTQDATFAGNVAIAANGLYVFASRSILSSAVGDGVVTLFNNAQNSFTRLNFGGITSAAPAIKKNGAALNFRLADDSADADITASNITGSAHVTAGASSGFKFSGRSQIASTGDGLISIYNAAGTDFTRLQLGGTTASFPAIKRNGTTLAFRLADDSADADITAANILGSADIRAGAAGAIYWNGRSALRSSADSVVNITNQAGTAMSTVTYGATGGATSYTHVQKAVTSIANAAATDVLTVTVPNAAHSATLKITLSGSIGAGGAIGANEATGTISYSLSITRTAGVATVTTTSSGFGSATSSVAGATTITITAAASAMTGGVGAQQTFTVQVTISRGGGSSTNHTCYVEAEILNSNTTGITIS